MRRCCGPALTGPEGEGGAPYRADVQRQEGWTMPEAVTWGNVPEALVLGGVAVGLLTWLAKGWLERVSRRRYADSMSAKTRRER